MGYYSKRGSHRGGGFLSDLVENFLDGDAEQKTAFVVELIALGAISGALVHGAVSNNQVKESKEEFNNVIVETVNKKGGEVASVDTKHFDWETQDKDYFFKFAGNAMTLDNEEIDFFAAKYKVDENQFKEILDYIDKKNIKDLDSKGLLNRLTGIIKDAELVETNLLENVAVKGIPSSSEIEKTGDNVILNVTKPIVGDNTVGYRVCYLQGVRTQNGKLGFVKSYAEVQFDKTKDLEGNPAGVFFKDKTSANVNVVHREYAPIEQYQIMNLETMQSQEPGYERI